MEAKESIKQRQHQTDQLLLLLFETSVSTAQLKGLPRCRASKQRVEGSPKIRFEDEGLLICPAQATAPSAPWPAKLRGMARGSVQDQCCGGYDTDVKCGQTPSR